MKLYAPKYYKEFTCIADKCLHSCCVGWEIDIDEVSREKYSSLSAEYGKVIRESIDYTETPHFRLGCDDRCPHLDERGLCKIITNCGEEYLCDICREHPRFYNDTSRGKEVGLGMSCEEACRLILSSDDYAETVCIGEVDRETQDAEFDTLSLRERIYSVLSDDAISYIERLCRIFKDFSVSPAMLDDIYWRETLNNLEYLTEEHREQFKMYSSDLATPSELEKPLERALAYFVYRHCASAVSAEDFREYLGFCLFCERLIASIAKTGMDIFEAARIVSEEIEYSEDNTETIKMEFSYLL